MGMRIWGLALCLAVSACGGGGGSDAPAQPSVPNAIPVYLMAGQSNINGSDAVIAPSRTDDLVTAGLQTDADRATRFTMASPSLFRPWGDVRGHDGYANGEAMVGDKPIKVHGPEVGFGRSFGGGIAVIKYASNYFALEGGRSAWVAPGSRWTAWQSFVDQQLAALDRPYRVAGLVWMQGIDDGGLARDGASYQADLEQMLRDVRAKFGPIPVVVVHEIDSQIVGSAAMAPIRAAQVTVSRQPGNALVSVDDLPLAAVHHLTSAGQLVAGQRYAEAMKGVR